MNSGLTNMISGSEIYDIVTKWYFTWRQGGSRYVLQTMPEAVTLLLPLVRWGESKWSRSADICRTISDYQTNWPCGMADVYLAKIWFWMGEERLLPKVLEPTTRQTPIAVARFQRESTCDGRPRSSSYRSNYGYPWWRRRSAVPNYGICVVLTSTNYIKRTLSSLTRAVRIMGQILLAMRLAHAKLFTVIWNRKIFSWLLMALQSYRLWDCGEAFAETSLTQTNSMLGSVHYLSPEQARVVSKATIQSDIWSSHGDYFLWNDDRSYSLWRR